MPVHTSKAIITQDPSDTDVTRGASSDEGFTDIREPLLVGDGTPCAFS